MALLHYILAIALTVSVAMARTGQAQSNIAIGAGVTTLRFAPSFESTVWNLRDDVDSWTEWYVVPGG